MRVAIRVFVSIKGTEQASAARIQDARKKIETQKEDPAIVAGVNFI
jgi:hypothetical protein